MVLLKNKHIYLDIDKYLFEKLLIIFNLKDIVIYLFLLVNFIINY